MSLKKQLMLFINGVVIILLAATFWINLDNTRSFLQHQLESHAQDTATSLGLTLSHVADPEDVATMETIINAIFDRGYYREITLTDPDGKVIYKRENPLKIEGIPGWFIHMIDLQPATAQAYIVAGWIPIGHVKVVSHPGYAYAELWQNFLNLLKLFVIITLVSSIIVLFYLKNLLAPLQKLVDQARLIVQRRFVYQKELPKTPELRQVVIAINSMVERLKSIFEREARHTAELQKLAYTDEVTGLGNRAHFEVILNSALSDDANALPGSLVIVHLDDLKKINSEHGYLKGNAVMKALADLFSDLASRYPQSTLARINGAEMAILLPQVPPHQIVEAIEKRIEQWPERLKELLLSPSEAVVYAAVTDFRSGEQKADVLGRVDHALKTARDRHLKVCVQATAAEEDQHFVTVVRDALEQARLILLGQPAVHAEDAERLHDIEIYARLQDEQGNLLEARRFIPVLKALGAESAFDRLVLSKVFEHASRHPTTVPFAVNVTERVLLDDDLQQWLLQQVKTNQRPLAFEMPEYFLELHAGACQDFMARVREAGGLVGFDGFGRELGERHDLHALQPDYVKLAHGFVKPLLSGDEKTQAYLASVLEMTENIGVTVIATGVESEAAAEAFKALGFEWLQGRYQADAERLNHYE